MYIVLQLLSINKYYKYFGYAIISLFLREEKEAGSAPGTIFQLWCQAVQTFSIHFALKISKVDIYRQREMVKQARKKWSHETRVRQ